MGDLYEKARSALAFGGPWRCAWTPYSMRRYVAPAIKGARLSREEAAGLVQAIPTGYEGQKLQEALRDDSVAPDGRGLQLIVDEFESCRRNAGNAALRAAFGNVAENPYAAYADAMDGMEECWRLGLLRLDDSELVASYMRGDTAMTEWARECLLSVCDGLSPALGRRVRRALDTAPPDTMGMEGLARWLRVLRIPTREEVNGHGHDGGGPLAAGEAGVEPE